MLGRKHKIAQQIVEFELAYTAAQGPYKAVREKIKKMEREAR
jgi:hypothetical protein